MAASRWICLPSRREITKDGAHEWNRTIDLLLTKEVLYRLSYVSRFSKQVVHCNAMVERETGIEPALVAWKATVLPLNYSRAGSPACVAPLAGKAAGYRVEPLKLVEGGGFEPPKA